MDLLSKFSERLNDLMSDAQITPKQLGAAINHNFYDIYHWKSGNCKSMPFLRNVLKLADYFCCSLDFLLGLEQESNLTNVRERPQFSERLPIVIKQKGENIHRLSIKTGIDEGSFYDWINNKHEPQIETLIKLASVLDCSIDYLLGRED